MAHRPTRRLTLSLLGLLAAPALLSGQDYTQYEVQYMTPKTGELRELNEAMAAHNQEYHSGSGPYHANVWAVVNGPRTGQLAWIMGPATFAQLDSRPAAGGHDDDWQDNVLPHLEPEGDVSYWRRVDNASYQADDAQHPILRIRGFRVAPGRMADFMDQRRQVKEVAEAKNMPRSEAVFVPRFRPETGPAVIVVMPFDAWADLDEGTGFRAAFIDVHGQGAWQRWIDANQAIIEDSWDEYLQLIPELSGGN